MTGRTQTYHEIVPHTKHTYANISYPGRAPRSMGARVAPHYLASRSPYVGRPPPYPGASPSPYNQASCPRYNTKLGNFRPTYQTLIWRLYHYLKTTPQQHLHQKTHPYQNQNHSQQRRPYQNPEAGNQQLVRRVPNPRHLLANHKNYSQKVRPSAHYYHWPRC